MKSDYKYRVLLFAWIACSLVFSSPASVAQTTSNTQQTRNANSNTVPILPDNENPALRDSLNSGNLDVFPPLVVAMAAGALAGAAEGIITETIISYVTTFGPPDCESLLSAASVGGAAGAVTFGLGGWFTWLDEVAEVLASPAITVAIENALRPVFTPVCDWYRELPYSDQLSMVYLCGPTGITMIIAIELIEDAIQNAIQDQVLDEMDDPFADPSEAAAILCADVSNAANGLNQVYYKPSDQLHFTLGWEQYQTEGMGIEFGAVHNTIFYPIYGMSELVSGSTSQVRSMDISAQDILNHFGVSEGNFEVGARLIDYSPYHEITYGLNMSIPDNYFEIREYAPALRDGFVTPSSGTVGTNFRFSVTYADRNNEPPATNNMKVYVDGSQYTMSTSGSNWIFGQQYLSAGNLTFAQGTHNYYFQATQGSTTSRYPVSGNFQFVVSPAGATIIQVTASANPNPCTPSESVQVTGIATYNNGLPVSNGTVTIAISGWDSWTASTASNGSYSRYISAPSSSGGYTVNVSASDGVITGSTSFTLSVNSGSSGNSYDFVRSTVCESVQSSDPYNPIGESPAYCEDDVDVFIWVHLEELYEPVRLRVKWYRPNGSLYTTCTGDWTDDPGSGYYYDWWKLWCSLYISGYDVSDIEGQWTAEIYIDEGDGFDYITTEDFTIRYDFVEHRMCRNVQSNDPWNPIGITNTFNQTDGLAYTWMKCDIVSIPLEIRWDWYEPNGTLYTQSNYTTGDPGSDYWEWMKAWSGIYIDNAAAEGKTGNWEVRVFIKDPSGNWDQEYADHFEIRENPNVNPQVSVVPSPANPMEGQSISLQFSVTDNAYLANATLNWNDGSPHSQNWSSINSSALNHTSVIGSYPEAAQVIYWGSATDASGNSTETPHVTLTVLDSDVQGPEITNVAISEFNGNSNGNIEAGEQIRFDWSASDASGISSVTLFVNGTSIPVQGTYYSLCGQFAPGNYPFSITVTDNDNSHSSTTHSGVFTVDAPSAPIVTEPNGGELWTVGAPAMISWNPGSTSFESIDILLSRDNGGSWNPLITGYIGATHTWEWDNVTTPESDLCLIKIVGNFFGGASEDVSDAVFMIYPPASCLEVSADIIEGAPGELLELPIRCEDLTAADITAFQFTLSFNPDSLQAESPYFSLEGCLAVGWTLFEVHDNTAGTLTLGGFGVAPLSGSGVLIKARLRLVEDALPGSCSPVNFDSFTFNEGVPCASTTAGRICTRMTNRISGCVEYYGGAFPIPNVTIVCNHPPSQLTSATGHYEFHNLLSGESYLIMPDPFTDQINCDGAISFFDASLAAQGAIGLITLDPLQSCAADVSCNEQVSFFDASLIAQFAIGIITEWPEDCDYNTICYEPTHRTYEPLIEDHLADDYAGICMGDVSGNWTPATSLDGQGYGALIGDNIFDGRTLRLSNFAGTDAYSVEITVGFSSDQLRFTDYLLNPTLENWTVYFISDQSSVTLGAFGASPVAVGEAILDLRFQRAHESASQFELEIIDYRINEDYRAHGILQSGVSPLAGDFQLLQNYPNPFNPTTEISFITPIEIDLSIRVFDLLGREVDVLLNQRVPAGDHKLNWTCLDCASGIYLISMQAPGFHSVRKAVFMK